MQALKLVCSGPVPCTVSVAAEEVAIKEADEEKATGEPFVRVDTPSVIYQESQVDGSRLRKGTRRIFVTVEYPVTLWVSKATLVVEISTEGQGGQMQRYLHLRIPFLVVAFLAFAGCALFLWRRQKLIQADEEQRSLNIRAGG